MNDVSAPPQNDVLSGFTQTPTQIRRPQTRNSGSRELQHQRRTTLSLQSTIPNHQYPKDCIRNDSTSYTVDSTA